MNRRDDPLNPPLALLSFSAAQLSKINFLHKLSQKPSKADGDELAHPSRYRRDPLLILLAFAELPQSPTPSGADGRLRDHGLYQGLCFANWLVHFGTDHLGICSHHTRSCGRHSAPQAAACAMRPMPRPALSSEPHTDSMAAYAHTCFRSSEHYDLVESNPAEATTN